MKRNVKKFTKKIIAGMIAVSMLSTNIIDMNLCYEITAYAAEAEISGACGDNATYTLSADGKVLTISGTGDMYDYEVRENPLYEVLHETTSRWFNQHYYIGNIKKIVIEDGITHVGGGFFYWIGDDEPIEVSIGNTVTSIGKYAFASTKISTISFPESLLEIDDYAFEGCRLESVLTFPANLQRVGKHAFEMNNHLQGATFTGTNTIVDEYAFASCSAYSDEINATYDLKGVTSVRNNAFEGVTFAKNITNTSKISTIGDYAFSHCQDVTTIDISGATKIGEYAFKGCKALEEITFSNSLKTIGDYAFYQDPSIKTIEIPDSVTYIGKEAFSFNDSLTSVSLPEDANITFGDGVFANDYNLISINLPKNMTEIPNGFIAGSGLSSISIPSGVKNIGDNAFVGSYNLTKVDLPQGLTTIGDYAFERCENLENITLPSTITSIGHCCFRNCVKIKSFNLSQGLLSIGDNAFSGCESITSISIPAGIKEIPKFCFVGCKKLSNLDLPEGLTTIGKQAFGGCPLLTEVSLPLTVTRIDALAFSGDIGLTSINIPNGVTEISESVFDGCTALQSITLPSTIKTIGKKAFYDCTLLKTINIPEGVTSIGDYAFAVDDYKIYKGVPLTSITLPSTLKIIGAYAFYECHNLTEVVIPEGCLFIGDYAFYGVGGMKLTKITIPESTVDFGKTYGESNIFSDSTISKMTMYGKTGSMAEKYATEHGINFESNGTASGDVAVYKSGSCGETANWTLYYDGTLRISGTGEMSDYDVVDCVYTGIMSPWYEDRDRIESVVVEGGITRIGNYAFEECDYLTTVILSEGIIDIGDEAFFRCYSISDITIPSTVRNFGGGIFMYCTSLKNVNLPEGITTLGDSMFDYCKSLDKIDFPSTLTTIGENAFCRCENLTSISIPSGVTELKKETFNSCYNLKNVILPGGLITIGDGCFVNCIGLTKFNIPDSVERIESGAFTNCENLSAIKIPTNVTYLGKGAFAGTGLTSITIPAGVNTLGDSVFGSCAKLESVRFERTTAFEYALGYTFENCTSLKNVSFAGNCFGDEFLSRMFKKCTSLERITIPEGVKHLGNESFYGCTKLKYVTLPSTINTVFADVFEGCTSLAHINLPNSMEEFEGFKGCSNLSTLVLPTNSYTGTFENCGGLTKLVMPKADYRIGLEGDAWLDLRGCENITLYAFSGSGIQEFAEKYGHTYKEIVASGSCGDGSMAYLAEDGNLFISGSGVVTKLPDTIEYKNVIQKVYVANGITEISDNAMADMTSVDEIELPVSVNRIAETAFAGCKAGVSIKADKGSYGYNWASNHEFEAVGNHDYYLNHTYYELNNLETFTLKLMDGDEVATGVTWELTKSENGGYSVAEDYVTLQTSEGSGECTIYGKEPIGYPYITVIAHVGNQSYECVVNVLSTYWVESFDLDKTEMTLSSVGETGDASIVIIPNIELPEGASFVEGKHYRETGYNVYEGEGIVEVTKDEKNPLLFHIKALKEGTAKISLYTGKPSGNARDNYSGTVTVIVPKPVEEHKHDFSMYKSNNNGTHKVVCKACGTVQEGHNKDACSGGAATCTAKAKCSKCKAEYGSLKAHTNTTITTKATLSKDGSKVTKCSVCGKVESTTTIAMPKTFTLSKTSVEYTGSQIKPTITVKDKNGTTIAATNYTVTYGTNKAVGKGTVKVTFKSESNYSDSKTLEFKIVPKKTAISTPVIASDGITVKWTKNTTGSGYYIYRSVNGASYTKVKTITSNATVSWKDTGAKTNGTKYMYKVEAYKTVSGTTYKSAVSAAKTMYFVSKPAISSANNSAAGKILLKWTRNAKATGYQIQYSTSSSFASPKSVTATGTSSTLSKTIASLTKGKTYYVRIRSYKTVSNVNYYSVWSATKSVKITK